MSLLNNRPLMLVVVVVLLTIKFVLQPVIEWQNQKAVENSRLEIQLQKGLALIQNQDELNAHLTQINQRLGSLTSVVLGKDDSVAAYQLRVQKQVEKLMENHAIVARNINWLSPYTDEYSEEQKLEINLSGQTKDFILFLLDIEQALPKLSVVEFSTVISRQYPTRKKLGNLTGRLVLTGWRATKVDPLQGDEGE